MTTMHLIFNHLNPALEDARTLPADKLPKLAADLEEIRCTLLARLSAPAHWHTVGISCCPVPRRGAPALQPGHALPAGLPFRPQAGQEKTVQQRRYRGVS